ncbi:histamine H3 receptor-like [Asterias rubens]|uniref:histamine H3 receptor-like n=1 Tax=Asterias rubens TaxID=7604 RepID=UPI001455907F|nr:histamine H3 receptor-like [Asterias rubens]
MNGTAVPATVTSSLAGVSKPNIGLAVAFSLVLVVTLFGNIATLIVFKFNDWLKIHRCHTYIIGLAVADVGTALVPLPANILISLGLWNLSRQGCMAYDYFRLVLENNGILITLLISIDRFRLLKWDFKSYIKANTCKRVATEIAVTWLLPAVGHGIMAVIWILSVPLENREADYSSDCLDVPSEADIPFSTMYATLLIFIPGALLAIFSIFTFIGVSRLLKRRRKIASGMAFMGPPVPRDTSNPRPNTSYPNNQQQCRCVSSNQLDPGASLSAESFTNSNDAPSLCTTDDGRGKHSVALGRRPGPVSNATNNGTTTRRKRDVQMTRYIRPAVMLAGIVSVFTLCWFPFAIYYVYIHIISPSSFSSETQAWLRCLLYASSAINPGIYALTDRKLRQGYRRIWLKLRRRVNGNF